MRNSPISPQKCLLLRTLNAKAAHKMLNMPPITKNLIIINLLMYLAKIVALRYGIDFDDLLGLHFFMASDFRLYQLFTYMFVHGGWEHIFFNMFAVWMFGRIMEQAMGQQRYLFYYIVCGLGAGLLQEGVQYIQYIYEGLDGYENVNLNGMTVPMAAYLNAWTTVGASGAVYGVLLSFGMTFPEERLFIIPFPFPIKAKWFVIGYAVIELMSAMGNPGDGVAHMAHLGGMLFGLALLLYWRHRDGGNRGGRFFGSGSGFSGYNNYYTKYEDVSDDQIRHTSPWQRMTAWFKTQRESISKRWDDRRRQSRMKANIGGKHNVDMEWNQQKQQREKEIDKILDKVKHRGYGSLTEEEKRKLFDASEK